MGIAEVEGKRFAVWETGCIGQSSSGKPREIGERVFRIFVKDGLPAKYFSWIWLGYVESSTCFV